MNKGIEILLARMESHPEEFARDNDRWEHLFNHYKKYVSDQDKQVFWDKLCEIRSQEFTERVIKALLAGEVHDVVETPKQMPYQHPYNTVTLGQSAFTANSLHVGSETLDEEMIRLMKEQLKQYKATGKI